MVSLWLVNGYSMKSLWLSMVSMRLVYGLRFMQFVTKIIIIILARLYPTNFKTTELIEPKEVLLFLDCY